MLSMLNYVKTVLSKVSFDAKLFEKELKKAIELLMGAEIQELKQWCYSRFGNQHEAILNRCFVVA
jgi:hypothetical protein